MGAGIIECIKCDDLSKLTEYAKALLDNDTYMYQFYEIYKENEELVLSLSSDHNTTEMFDYTDCYKIEPYKVSYMTSHRNVNLYLYVIYDTGSLDACYHTYNIISEDELVDLNNNNENMVEVIKILEILK